MIPLAQLKQDLGFVKDLGNIVDAFKTAALLQFHMFQRKEKPINGFLEEIEDALKIIGRGEQSSLYFVERSNLPSAYVVITSDEGFLGELNTLLINATLDKRDSKEDEIVVLGERGAKYLEETGEGFIFFPGVSEDVDYREVQKLRNYLLREYETRFNRIVVIYPEFVSLVIQKVKTIILLPYVFEEGGLAEEIKYKEILIEPDKKNVIEEIVRLMIGFKLWEVFWSAKQSEYAARIMHLEGSTQELNHLTKKLHHLYFKQLHALSDKTIREISASKILLKRKFSK